MQTTHNGMIRGWMASTAVLAALIAVPAAAQQAPMPSSTDGSIANSAASLQDGPQADSPDAIVVTGSRIRRAGLDNAAPVAEITSQAITDRGFITAADALNNLPSNAPVLNQADGSGN